MRYSADPPIPPTPLSKGGEGGISGGTSKDLAVGLAQRKTIPLSPQPFQRGAKEGFRGERGKSPFQRGI
jgi:hypothetical protein